MTGDLFKVYKYSNLRDLFEEFGVTSTTSVNLSLTQKCNWKCIFCYKNCPKPIQFDPDDLLAMIRVLPMYGISFGITGGEPTLYPYWRNLLKLFYGTRGLSIITQASGIRLKTDEDIQLLLLATSSCKISIHGVGRGAIEVTKSRAQKGLAFLKKLADEWNKTIESLERRTNSFNYKITVNVAVLKENVNEIPVLIERISEIYDEYGKPDKIDIFRPEIMGRMKKNIKSVLELNKFIELCRELKSVFSDLPLVFNANYGNPSINIDCLEIEPDGYLYADMHRLKVGSWKKHKVHELIRYAYTYGLKIAKQRENEDCLIELPDFIPIYEKDTIYRLKNKELRFFTTNDGIVIVDSDKHISYILRGLIHRFIEIFTRYPLKRAVELIKPIDLKVIKPILDYLEQEGIFEKEEVEILRDFEIKEDKK